MKKKNKKGIFLMVCGMLLMLAAACLAIYNSYEDERAASLSDDVLSKLKQTIESSDSDIDYTEKTFSIGGYDYIGYLTIPAADIETPVMAQWDYKRLKISVCRYYGSAYTNDLIIAGHNYRSCFGKLSRLSVDDEVLFTDADGVKYKYKVGEIEILAPTDTQKMIESDWDLTLYTCTYGARGRITVRCQRMDK